MVQDVSIKFISGAIYRTGWLYIKHMMMETIARVRYFSYLYVLFSARPSNSYSVDRILLNNYISRQSI